MKKTISRVLLLCLIALACTACGQKKLTRYDASFLELFDTVTMVVGYAESKEAFEATTQKLRDALEEYHQLYDIYHSYEGLNNIKTINDQAGQSPVTVDRRVIDLLLFAKEAYALTEGSVNVAMGSLLSVWHEYRDDGLHDPENAALPSEEELLEAAKSMDIADVIIDEEASTVYLADANMRLDVGAIAKGYALEMVAREAPEGMLLSVGGNVRATGGKPGGEFWGIGVQSPSGANGEYLHTLNLTEGSVVTSGSYQRHYTVDGKQYHHIIDPATRWPAEHFSAVTVVCMDSGRADALSTAVYVLPYEEGKQLIAGLPDTEALWVLPDGELLYTDGYAAMIRP